MTTTSKVVGVGLLLAGVGIQTGESKASDCVTDRRDTGKVIQQTDQHKGWFDLQVRWTYVGHWATAHFDLQNTGRVLDPVVGIKDWWLADIVRVDHSKTVVTIVRERRPDAGSVRIAFAPHPVDGSWEQVAVDYQITACGDMTVSRHP